MGYNAADTSYVLDYVNAERKRQEQLKLEGRFTHTCADNELTPSEKVAVLAEEFGEVAHEVTESIGNHAELDRAALRKELIQVAAVAVAWVECLDREDP
jgi:NTP pyrophosphatase (non-canonical NTP hydrolase)